MSDSSTTSQNIKGTEDATPTAPVLSASKQATPETRPQRRYAVRNAVKATVKNGKYIQKEDPKAWGKLEELLDPQAIGDMPADMLPPALRDWIADEAERMGCYRGMIAAPAVAAAMSLIGRSCGIMPGSQDTWLVIPTGWCAIVAGPGSMKSPAIDAALRFVRAANAAARKKYESELRDLEKTPHEERDPEKPKFRQLIINDATPEALSLALKANPRGALYSRDELSGWLSELDRSGREPERAMFLTAFDGDKDYTYNRIGRGIIHIPGLCLSLLGGIQPDRLRRYISEAVGDDPKYANAADGLLQRFQLLLWFDTDFEGDGEDRAPNDDAQRCAREAFDRLNVFCEMQEDDAPQSRRFSDDAQKIWNRWRKEHKARTRDHDAKQNPAYAAHLVKYRKLVPGLALTFHLLEPDAQEPVSTDALKLAIEWATYLDFHARKTYSVETRTPERILAERIKRRMLLNETRLQLIAERGWPILDNVAAARDAVEALAKRNWCRIETRPPKRKPGSHAGGHASEVVCLHPDLLPEDE
jgi:putative DNA primase/helicase